MEQDGVVGLILRRNAFYRKLYMFALAAFLLGLCVIAGLIWMVHIVYREPTAPIYFPVDPVGTLINDVPVNQKIMTDEQLANFTKGVVEEINSYNYVNYRAQFQKMSQYFTPEAWIRFQNAFQTESINPVNTMLARKLIVSAKVTGSVEKVQDGYWRGAYIASLRMPMRLTIWEPPYSDKTRYFNDKIVTIMMVRQPILQSMGGMSVVQIISQDVSTGGGGQREIAPLH